MNTRIFLCEVTPYAGDVRTIMEHRYEGNDTADLWQARFLSPSYFEQMKLYVARNGVKGDAVPNIWSWPIVSDRYRRILEPLCAEGVVQWFHAPLFDQKTRKPEPGYWVMNILTKVDCLNMERSKYSFFPDTDVISAYETYCLDASRIPSAGIFRATNTAAEFFVSEAVARFSRHSNVTGIALTEVEMA